MWWDPPRTKAGLSPQSPEALAKRWGEGHLIARRGLPVLLKWRRENQTVLAMTKGEEMAAKWQAAPPRPGPSALTQQPQRASCRCGPASLSFRALCLPG